MDASQLNEAISQFGAHLGVDTLVLSSEGLAELQFENGSALSLEQRCEILLMLYSAPIRPISAGTRQQILALADYRNGWTIPIGCTLTYPDAQPILFTRIPLENLDAPLLLDTFSQIQQAAERLPVS